MPNFNNELKGLSRSDLELIIGAGPHVPETVKQTASAILLGNLATDTTALLAAMNKRSPALRECIAQLQTLKEYLDSSPLDDLAGEVTTILDTATASLGGRSRGDTGAVPSRLDDSDTHVMVAGSATPASTSSSATPRLHEQPKPEVTITPALIMAADSSNSPEYANSLATAMSDLAVAYAINTPLRVAHFLSQIGHESSFKTRAESGNYKAKRMREVFGCKGGMKNYDATKDDCKIGRLRSKLWTEEARYAGNARNLLSYAYALRMGNGDEASGDGFKYRGRGMVQLTGKTNYSDFTKSHNLKFSHDRQDFVANPDLISTGLKYGIESAFFFWNTRNINEIADRDNIKEVTRKVNGGLNGLSDRKLRLARVRLALGI